MKIIKKANDLMELSIKVEKAVEIACMVCNINQKEFYSSSRLRHIVDARRIVYSYCRESLEMHWMAIAEQFKINHATAIHHCKTHKQLVECDSFYFSKYNSFAKLLSEEITLFDIDKIIQLAKKLKQDEEKNKSKK